MKKNWFTLFQYNTVWTTKAWKLLLSCFFVFFSDHNRWRTDFGYFENKTYDISIILLALRRPYSWTLCFTRSSTVLTAELCASLAPPLSRHLNSVLHWPFRRPDSWTLCFTGPSAVRTAGLCASLAHSKSRQLDSVLQCIKSTVPCDRQFIEFNTNLWINIYLE